MLYIVDLLWRINVYSRRHVINAIICCIGTRAYVDVPIISKPTGQE